MTRACNTLLRFVSTTGEGITCGGDSYSAYEMRLFTAGPFGQSIIGFFSVGAEPCPFAVWSSHLYSLTFRFPWGSPLSCDSNV